MSTIDAFLEDVRSEARSLDPLKVLLTILAGPFFVLGWMAGHAARFLVAVAFFAWSAGVVGWRQARGERGEDPAT